jgi:hypothetical protein
MMRMAVNQNIIGQVFAVGVGPDGEATLTTTQSDEQEPYRIIDGQPLFYTAKNTFQGGIPYWESNRVHKWGYIDHPNLLGTKLPHPGDGHLLHRY